MIPIGHGNYVESSSIVAILKPDSSPAKKLKRGADESGMLINATSGRKARSLIVLDSRHIVLSSLQPETIKERLRKVKFNSENDFNRQSSHATYH